MALTKKQKEKKKQESRKRKFDYITDYNKKNYYRFLVRIKLDEEAELIELFTQEPHKNQLVKELLKKHYGIERRRI